MNDIEIIDDISIQIGEEIDIAKFNYKNKLEGSQELLPKYYSIEKNYYHLKDNEVQILEIHLYKSLNFNTKEMIESICKINSLRCLHLSGVIISDLTFLRKLKKLTHLVLDNCEIENIEIIKELKQLISLCLPHNLIKDLSPLSELSNITYLDLTDNKITELIGINLSQMEHLFLAQNSIADISFFKGNNVLKSLNLNSNIISDLSTLVDLKHLTCLKLENNKITNIDSIKCVTNLKRLLISNIQTSDFLPLSELKYLEELHLCENSIKDISFITGLTNLTFVWLDNNNITNIEPLRFLNKLDRLWISKNKIIHVPSWLRNWYYDLSISDNPLSESSKQLLEKRRKEINDNNDQLSKLGYVDQYGHFVTYENSCDLDDYNSSKGYNDNLDSDQQSIEYWDQF